MNKFIAILALAAVVAVVSEIASANKHLHRKFPHGHHELEEELLEGEHEGLHGHGHLGHLSDDLLLEELRNRHHLHHLLPFRHRLHGKRGGFRRGPLVGAGAGIGAAGGVEAAEGKFGAVGANTHLGKHGSIEGKKGGLIAGKKGFEISHHDTDLKNDEGLHKHQVFNKDKTFINDRVSGVNDVDAFRKTRLHNDGGSLGAGAAGLAAGEASGRIEGGADFDHSVGAIGAQGAEGAAIGGVGAGIGAGAEI